MNNEMRHIVVVGGGTAGWLTACILASKLNTRSNHQLKISLIESPDIPTIGVGEGTVPTMRQTLKLIGVSESDFIKHCDATFKQSIKFIDWLNVPDGNKHHYYHHLFNYPKTPGFDLTPYWLMGDKNLNYANAITNQELACEHFLSPKKITQKEYDGLHEYAYHLDASKFAQFLSKHAVDNLGIEHLQSTIIDVSLKENGNIDELETDSLGKISGDFYIDCSGFRSRLSGQALGVEFIDKGHQLFVNKAVAMQVPYKDQEQEIPPFTLATAKEAGWIWDIGLSKRRGVGHVYSTDFISDDKAEQLLRDYVGDECTDIESRKIPMRIGYRSKFWHKNCVAIGLSAGFVEPLEATAILIVEATAKLLAEKLPIYNNEGDYGQNSFNKITRYAWDRVFDFIKLHYYLSKREDNLFWVNNRDPDTVSDALLDKLEHWKTHIPCQSDFFSKYEVFQLENYQYVLYGMNYQTDLRGSLQQYPYKNEAQKFINQLNSSSELIARQLESHRKTINQIKQHGLNKI